MPRIFFVMLAVAAFGAGLIFSGPAAAQSDPLDCEDYASQADAQAAYREDPTDPADNDGDDDGIACELFEFQDPTTDLTPIGEEPEDDADEGEDEDAEAEATETPAAVGAATGTLPTSGTGSAIASSLGGQNSVMLLSLVGAAALCGLVAMRGVRGRA